MRRSFLRGRGDWVGGEDAQHCGDEVSAEHVVELVRVWFAGGYFKGLEIPSPYC